MRARSTMSAAMPARGAETEPNQFLGDVSPGHQTGFQFPRNLRDWFDLGLRGLQQQVAAGWESQGAYADDCGLMNGDCSLRLRNAPDDKGRPQQPLFKMLMALLLKPGAFVAWCAPLLRELGFEIVPLRLPSAEETARALAAEMTEKQKRRLERERGWPEGWLDR